MIHHEKVFLEREKVLKHIKQFRKYVEYYLIFLDDTQHFFDKTHLRGDITVRYGKNDKCFISFLYYGRYNTIARLRRYNRCEFNLDTAMKEILIDCQNELKQEGFNLHFSKNYFPNWLQNFKFNGLYIVDAI